MGKAIVILPNLQVLEHFFAVLTSLFSTEEITGITTAPVKGFSLQRKRIAWPRFDRGEQ
jgi:hypothetical protein